MAEAKRLVRRGPAGGDGETRLRLEPAEVIRRTEAATGLGAYLTDGVRERLERTLARFNATADFTWENIQAASAQVEATLAARLRLERDRRLHPGIAEEQVAAPIVVIGFSRTGTTVMQCLLGCDPANRRVTWAEAMHPSPPPGLGDGPGEVARTTAAYQDLAGWIASTGILRGHPYHDLGICAPVEDEELFALDFLSDYPTRYFRTPYFPVDTSTDDPARAYAFLRELLQHLQWRCPPRRWVLKGIFHSFVLDVFLSCFPDARCIWTHRDPVAIVASTLQLSFDVYDPIQRIPHVAHARRMLTSVRAGFDAFMSSPLLDDPRIHHVRFKDFMSDQVAVIREAYDYFGMPFSPEFEAGMRDWLARPENRSDRYGKFTYDLDALGLNRGDIAQLFADYSDRFDVGEAAA